MKQAKDRRYFYTDAPSPLHRARDEYRARRREAVAEINALLKEHGATDAVGREYIIGFVFKSPPATWRSTGFTDEEGRRVYMPKRNTTEGRALYKKIRSIVIPTPNSILYDTGLDISRVNGRCMSRSTCGWSGDRIFVTIPNTGEGDRFPEIPDYLTECARWEVEKYETEYYEKNDAPFDDNDD